MASHIIDHITVCFDDSLYPKGLEVCFVRDGRKYIVNPFNGVAAADIPRTDHSFAKATPIEVFFMRGGRQYKPQVDYNQSIEQLHALPKLEYDAMLKRLLKDRDDNRAFLMKHRADAIQSLEAQRNTLRYELAMLQQMHKDCQGKKLDRAVHDSQADNNTLSGWRARLAARAQQAQTK